jgi:phage baseplate assembly protein W
MTDTQAYFGADLRLIRDLLQLQSDRSGGSDLLTATRKETSKVDLQTLTDLDNLKQALLLRFLTRMGDLAQLGHPAYGSRLYTLIGQLNTATNRNLAKLYVLEALAPEPRVERVISVDVSGARDTLDIRVSLTAIGSNTPLNMVFGFNIGGPQ